MTAKGTPASALFIRPGCGARLTAAASARVVVDLPNDPMTTIARIRRTRVQRDNHASRHRSSHARHSSPSATYSRPIGVASITGKSRGR